jgi:trigger factor
MTEETTENSTGGRKFTVTVSEEGDCKRVLSLEIPEDEVARERERVTRELQRELKVPGLRKGKVPLDYVKKNYAEMIQGDAVRNLLPEAYEEAVRQEGLHPLGDPSFDNFEADEGKGIRGDAIIEVRPDVKISGYDEVEVEASQKEIGDGDVTKTLEDLRERLAEYRPTDREAQSSDYLTIDYAPYLEAGELDEKARQTNYPVELSSENLFEEFKVGLVGMRSGDEKDIEVKYPDDFVDKELAGARKRFHVKVAEVKEKLLPDVDDAFAKRLNDQVDSLDDLKGRIKKDLEAEEDHRYKHDVEEKVIDRLIGENPFEVPVVMVENYLASVLEEDRRRRPNVPDETKRVAEVRELFREAAVRSIKKYFIMDAVGKQEGLEVGEEEVEARIASMAEDSGRSPEEVKEYFGHPERRRSLESELLDRKVMELLRGNARVKDAA